LEQNTIKLAIAAIEGLHYTITDLEEHIDFLNEEYSGLEDFYEGCLND
jgi:hypothetical protein